MVTLKEIAEECGVSATTVSNVLNGKAKTSEETRQYILRVIEERGYRPNYMARGLRSQSTRLIGLIAEDIAQFTTPEIVEGIMACCEENGYRTVMTNLRLYARWSDSWYQNEAAYHSILDPTLLELQSIMVDGIIYIAGHARYVHCFPENFSTPAVMAYAYASNPGVPSVLIDDEDAAYRIVKYMIEKGHRKIAIAAGLQNNIHTQKRLAGAQRAMFEAQIPFNPAWIRYINWNRQPAYEVAEQIVGTGASGIFCMTDRIAGGIYEYAHEKGIEIGKDLAVAGFDDQDIAEYFIPPLTTMKLPLTEIGNQAARLLFEEIEHKNDTEKKPGREILIPCTFRERDSIRMNPNA